MTRLNQTLVAACAASALLLSAQVATASDSEIITRAQAAYYGAKARGLKDFTCDANPSWELTLKDVADPAEKKAGLALLNKIHMTLHAGPGIPTVVGHSDLVAANPEQGKAYQQIYDGMQQAMGGFMTTYSLFMFDTPLPAPDSTYTLKPDGSDWTLDYEDSGEVHTTMDASFSIHEVHITGLTFKSSVQPVLTLSNEGFLLSGYRGTYDGFDSASEHTTLQVRIEHQTVDGFQVPKFISLSGASGGSPFEMDVTFKNCRVTKR